jgi:Carboxypeptidase regulatory-like domain
MRPVILVSVALLFGGLAWAATLTGIVKDPSGAAALHAVISARHESSGETKRAESDADGRFSLELAPGVYQIEIALAGFATVERRVMVANAKNESLEIKLELAATRTEVNVRDTSGEMANGDPNYRALREAQTAESFAVHDLVLRRDLGTLTLKSGVISFVRPVLGRVTMAAFRGDGEFTLAPVHPLERQHLRLITDRDAIQESFDRVVLCFTDDTYQEIKRQSEKGPDAPPERDALNDFRRRVRRHGDTPRSQTDYLLNFEAVDNVEADILSDLYNPRRAGFFSAYMFGRKHGDLRFHVRPRGALLQLPAP